MAEGQVTPVYVPGDSDSYRAQLEKVVEGALQGKDARLSLRQVAAKTNLNRGTISNAYSRILRRRALEQKRVTK